MSVVRHHYIKSLIASLLAVFLLAGLTGISVHVHYCHGNKTNVVFFPEIFKSGTSCLCHYYIADHNQCTDYQKIRHCSCCFDQHYIKRLNVEINNQESQTNIKDNCFHISAEHTYPAIHPYISGEIVQKPAVVPDPPGYKLYMLFHQFRVSSVQGDC